MTVAPAEPGDFSRWAAPGGHTKALTPPSPKFMAPPAAVARRHTRSNRSVRIPARSPITN